MKTRSPKPSSCLWVAALALAAAIAAPAAVLASNAPTFDELKNLKYSGFLNAAAPITLVNGRYEDAASHRSITLARGFRLTGDLDGDGRDEAVVLLAESAGGSGTFNYLAVVGRATGLATNLATAPLGDRVQVRDARIQGSRIVVDVLRPGPGDAMCCPGELATLVWVLNRRKLDSLPTSARPERLSLAALGGGQWVLRWWSWSEAVPAGIEITLAVEGDRLSGRAACNNYFATATMGKSPGDVAIGQAGSTRMACPSAQMAAESRFLRKLAGVNKYSFLAGQLAMSWNEGGKSGVMLFERGGRKP